MKSSTNPLKIAFVLDDSLDKTDGVQQYVLTLGTWLTSQGHSVHYLVGETHRRDLAHIHSLSKNVQVHFNQNRMTIPLPANRKRIRTLLTKEQFDVLHVQMPYSPWLAARIILAAPRDTQVVGTFHIIPFSGFERFATRLLAVYLWRSRRRFNYTVSVSPAAALFARHTFKVTERVIPNAVATTHFKGAKPYARHNDGAINIVFLGRLVERKGCQALLEALAELHADQQLDGVRVLLCGKGPLRRRLERFIKVNHLTHIVHLVGYVSEVEKPKYLAAADIAVFPSMGGESFGIVLVEAMAAARGVVLGGDNVGYRTVLGSKPKQLISPADTHAFAQTLKHYLRHRRLRDQARAWQQTEVQQYDVRVVGEQFLKIYKQREG